MTLNNLNYFDVSWFCFYIMYKIHMYKYVCKFNGLMHLQRLFHMGNYNKIFTAI